MNPSMKTPLLIIAYCCVLWLTNWSFHTTYERATGLTQRGVDLRVFAIVFAIVANLAMFRRLWALLRELLSLGVKVPFKKKIVGDWKYLLLLIPLGFGLVDQRVGTTEDGTVTMTLLQYGGGAASMVSIVLSGMAIMLFQTIINLERLHPHNKQNRATHTEHSREWLGSGHLSARAR